MIKVGYYGCDDIVGLAFDQVRRAAFTAGQVANLERLLKILDRAIEANRLPTRRRSLWAHAFAVARLAPQQVSDPEDAANLVVRAVGIGEGLLTSGLDVDSGLERLADLVADLPEADRVREGVRCALRDAAAR